MTGAGKSVYLACTPYHVMLACGIATSLDRNAEKYMVVMGDFPGHERLAAIVFDWGRRPFTGISVIPGKFGLTGKEINRLSRDNQAALRQLYSEKAWQKCDLFVFQDGNPESQALLYLNAKKHGRNVYVEDGAAAYREYVEPAVSLPKSIYARALWGHYFEQVRVPGTSRYVQSSLVFYPELVRAELRRREVLGMPKSLLTGLDMALIDAIAGDYGIRTEDLQARSIILAPHSETMPEPRTRYRAVYGRLMEELVARYGSVAIKYHPRETEGDFLGLGGISGVKQVPGSLPVEVLYLANVRNPPALVVDDLSTGLMTARIIYGEQTTVASMLRFLELPGAFDQLIRAFNRIGIVTPPTFDELLATLPGLAGPKT